MSILEGHILYLQLFVIISAEHKSSFVKCVNDDFYDGSRNFKRFHRIKLTFKFNEMM